MASYTPILDDRKKKRFVSTKKQESRFRDSVKIGVFVVIIVFLFSKKKRMIITIY